MYNVIIDIAIFGPLIVGLLYAIIRLQFTSNEQTKHASPRFMVCQRSAWASQQRAIQSQQKRVYARYQSESN